MLFANIGESMSDKEKTYSGKEKLIADYESYKNGTLSRGSWFLEIWDQIKDMAGKEAGRPWYAHDKDYLLQQIQFDILKDLDKYDPHKLAPRTFFKSVVFRTLSENKKRTYLNDKEKNIMTHIDIHDDSLRLIQDIRIGQTFIENGKVFMKTDSVSFGEPVCVDLETGEGYKFSNDIAHHIARCCSFATSEYADTFSAPEIRIGYTIHLADDPKSTAYMKIAFENEESYLDIGTGKVSKPDVSDVKICDLDINVEK